ncbi:MAG: 5'/3'-nucleotidase SurE [Acidimicrobiales bacterium]
MRVMVTNDDGISSPGLHELAVALIEAGQDVVLVAPKGDCSGFGAAIGPLHITGQVRFDRVEIDAVDRAAYAVEGPPALCVMAAAMGGFGPRPDLVVSGINAGANTGRAVLHSGTVGAALTALNFGIPGLAVSQSIGAGQEWSAAATLAAALAPEAAALRPLVALNLNVPNRTLSQIVGISVAKLDAGGTVQASMVEREAGTLQLQLSERPGSRTGSDTDTGLLSAGYATVTVMVGPHALAIDLARVTRDLDGLLTSERHPLSA